ncbi:MAG: ribokinase [Leptolyngbya sp. SIO1D8]|nr:ribokinase [Leptolyngbya sp. SIO1D8]
MSIMVFGSLNMDLVVQTPRLPVPGETLLGNQFSTIPGGKGANQAVAVARQEIHTLMFGRVGADGFGQELRHTLATDGVDISGVQIDPEAHTGVAAIAVSAQGENHIIVVPGANGKVGISDLQSLQKCFSQAKLLLMQFEIPISLVIEAAQKARAAGITVILDPAPAQTINSENWYQNINFLTPNQVEAAQLVGFSVDTVARAIEAAAILRQRGTETVLIKLGDQGVVCSTASDTFHVPAFSVKVVDTVAAGDAFNGGLAVALHDGKPLKESIVWASATAALSVTQAGAQPSLPSRSQVDAFLKSN